MLHDRYVPLNVRYERSTPLELQTQTHYKDVHCTLEASGPLITGIFYNVVINIPCETPEEWAPYDFLTSKKYRQRKARLVVSEQTLRMRKSNKKK